MTVDLHLHTSASDGALTPVALVELLARQGISACAVTDHDTLGGVPQAWEAARRSGVLLVPGVELSAGDGVEVHILGYFARVPGALHQALSGMRAQRLARLGAMLDKLREQGIDIQGDELPLAEGGVPGRVHVARALVAKGEAGSVSEAFTRYLTPGRHAYVAREKLLPKDAIRMIRDAGGAAVLAHPGIIQSDERLLPDRVRALAAHGLMGLEAYHSRHTRAQARRLDALARANKLLVTGGSDYHGLPGSLMPGDGLAEWRTWQADLFSLLHTIGFN